MTTPINWPNSFAHVKREPAWEGEDGTHLLFDGKTWVLFIKDGVGIHSTYPTAEAMAGLAERLLQALPYDEARREVLAKFCSYCGGRPGCQCWNDE